jgi:hypothetical protein
LPWDAWRARPSPVGNPIPAGAMLVRLPFFPALALGPNAERFALFA